MIRRQGAEPRAQLLLPLLPSLSGDKMSASNAEFHLDPCDTPKQIKKKIGRSFCEPGNITNNVVLQIARLFLLPLMNSGATLTLNRSTIDFKVWPSRALQWFI